VKFDSKQLASEAAIKALQIRKDARYSLQDPVSVYDLADRLGVKVIFTAIPSMEGIYLPLESPTILVSSLRPAGRQSFTCAHELGHHAFGHGEQFDELVDQRSEDRQFNPKEFQADCFAGALMMPKVAVKHGFTLRGWDPASCHPEAFYVIATWLGVGYTTLIFHMEKVLGLLNKSRAEDLYRIRIPSLRAALIGRECRDNLIIADQHWYGRAIDAQVNDIIRVPPTTIIEGSCVEVVNKGEDWTLAQAIRPGIGRVIDLASEWSSYVRVSRKEFEGRSRYRFEEEVDDA
jgi:Zn-dependent peptidase ImmA (M78 family)